MLHGNDESALLSNVANRESFPGFKRKSQAFELNLPHTGRVRTGRLLPGGEDRMILVESFTSHG